MRRLTTEEEALRLKIVNRLPDPDMERDAYAKRTRIQEELVGLLWVLGREDGSPS